MARVAILGAGMMGTAFATPIADAGHEVRLVGTPLDEPILDAFERDRTHPRMGVALPASVKTYRVSRLHEAVVDADVVALGVSSAGVPWACEVLSRELAAGVPVVMITKGLAWTGSAFACFPDVVRDTLPERLRQGTFPAAVAGPCIAGELARRVPTRVVVTGRDAPTLDRFAELFSTPYYHLAKSTRLVDVEICAALKNAFAMGIGFAAGLHEARGGAPGSVAMHNYEAAAFAEAVVEMGEVIRFAGGDPSVAMGLPGAGDLNVTCNGGRTGRFGKHLGTGMGLRAAVEAMDGATLECLEILAVMRAAKPALDAWGARLPMLWHLADVALDDAAVDMPFSRFIA